MTGNRVMVRDDGWSEEEHNEVKRRSSGLIEGYRDSDGLMDGCGGRDG